MSTIPAEHLGQFDLAGFVQVDPGRLGHRLLAGTGGDDAVGDVPAGVEVERRIAVVVGVLRRALPVRAVRAGEHRIAALEDLHFVPEAFPDQRRRPRLAELGAGVCLAALNLAVLLRGWPVQGDEFLPGEVAGLGQGGVGGAPGDVRGDGGADLRHEVLTGDRLVRGLAQGRRHAGQDGQHQGDASGDEAACREAMCHGMVSVVRGPGADAARRSQEPPGGHTGGFG